MIVTRDREAGNIIENFSTIKQAESAIKMYEKKDKKEGTYSPDFYEVAEIEDESFWAKKLGAKGGAATSPRKSASSRKNGKLGGRPKEILGKLYYYDGGQCLAEFRRGDEKDWFVWSPKRGQRLATYRTKKELMAAYDRSNNTDGGYGCALLHLDLDTDC